MTARQRQAEQTLEELRRHWEADRDPLHLYQAINWARGAPLPDWLTDALKQCLWDAIVSPKQRQQRELAQQRMRIVRAVRAAIHGRRPYPVFWAEEDEAATEEHFRAAAERLSAEGLTCTPESVKKTWHRYRPPPIGAEASLALITEDIKDE